MKLMKKVNALVLGLAVLLAFGCGNDDPEPPSQGLCQLLNSTDDGLTAEYIYNIDNQVIRINRNWANPLSKFHEEITYNSNGNLSEIKGFDNNDIQRVTWAFIYNANNLPDTVYILENSTKIRYIKYEYNSEKKLIKRGEYDPFSHTMYQLKEISYPTDEQTKEMVYSRDSATGGKVLQITR